MKKEKIRKMKLFYKRPKVVAVKLDSANAVLSVCVVGAGAWESFNNCYAYTAGGGTRVFYRCIDGNRNSTGTGVGGWGGTFNAGS